MKIDDIGKQQAIQWNREDTRQVSNAADGGFASLLQDEIEDTSIEAGSGSAVSEISSIPGMLALQSTTATNATDQIDAVGSVIDTLDSLGTALKQNASPKQVDSLISQLGDQASGLRSTLGDLPEDHPLQQMSEELNITAYMESVKSKRGDYA